MKIALHDADKNNYPNLALMKISAFHKSLGDDVSWNFSLLDEYDIIYSSKVFTFTPEDDYLSRTVIKGGTGYKTNKNLPDEIEHIMPDYSLYGIDYSMGFLTRGCSNHCKWCVVPEKEGEIRAHADIEEFAAHKDVVLLDNNVLASNYGLRQIEKIAKLGLRIDFNQGLDARLIDGYVAKLLSKVKWITTLRLACDSQSMIEPVRKAITLLRWYNVAPRRYSVYTLAMDLEETLTRIKFLKGMNVDPFVQPYRDLKGKIEIKAELKDLARWANHKAVFKSSTWEEYKKR